MADVSALAADKRKITDPILLTEPIMRGETAIETIQLRKPKAGELRGLSMQDLLNCRVSAILDILPRISVPVITAAEANDLEAADLTSLGGEIIGFLLTEGQKAQVEQVQHQMSIN